MPGPMADRRRWEADVMASMADGSFWQDVEDSHSHFDRHVGMSAPDLLDRVFGGKGLASSFSSADDMRFCVEEVVVYGLHSLHAALATAQAGERVELSARLDEDAYADLPFEVRHLGMARTPSGEVREMATNSTVVVASVDPDAPLGFSLLTAYPDLRPSELAGLDIEETGRDLAGDVMRTDLWAAASPVRRAYMLASVRPVPQGLRLRWSPASERYPEAAFVNFPGRAGVRYTAFVDEAGASVRAEVRDRGRWHNVPVDLDGRRQDRLSLDSPRDAELFRGLYPQVDDYVRQLRRDAGAIRGEDACPTVSLPTRHAPGLEDPHR